MCARYQTPSQAAAERYWQVIEPLWHFEPKWRALPTKQISIFLSLNGSVAGRMMRWGLIPYSGSTSYPLINATVEKLTTWYGWRNPWEHGRRCIFPMSGFYEPHVFPGGRKEPLYVHLRDRPVFGVARGPRTGTTVALQSHDSTWRKTQMALAALSNWR
jgi:putative SOS response-associated peptidase YedK